VQLGGPESFWEHLVKFSFFSFFSEKETRTAELWGCMWWENFFLQKLWNCFFSKISKTLPPPSNFRDPCTRPGHPCNFYLVS
jgi:hypothetical protein